MIHAFLVAPFADDTFRRAFVAVAILALGAAPMGVFLMLRRMTLMGDVMAHAMLPGAALAYLVAGLDVVAMAFGGLVAGIVVAVLAGLVARVTELREDASLATFYLVALALGVSIASVTGRGDDLLHLLFGDLAEMSDAALQTIAVNATLTLVMLAIIWRPLVLECVDPLFLRSVSRIGGPVHMIFMVLLTINLVSGFLALGTLLAVAMLVMPATIARFWTRDATALIAVAVAVAMSAGGVGLLIARASAMPPGPTIVLFAAVLALVSLIFGRTGGLLHRIYPGRHLRA